MSVINYETIPNDILYFIKNENLVLNSIGESLSKVIYIPSKHAYLKISPEIISYIPQNEYCIYKWLKGKLPTPEVLEYKIENNFHYMILTEVKGCSLNLIDTANKDDIVKLFASALRMIHSVNISECPIKYTTDNLISKIEFCIRNNIYGCSPYANNEETYKKLDKYRRESPEYEPVFIHGDAAMVNILAMYNDVTGIIDMGESGVYCKYRDIVHALSNLEYWGFGGDRYRKMFFDVYGLNKPDIEKIEYFNSIDYD
jgi:Aminoglycoside phosphotransferase